MLNEKELIQRSQTGDREAFGQLIHQYRDRMFNLAQQVCVRAPSEAEGVYQETFVNAMEKIGKFEGRSNLGTWLYRIAANLCWMRLRKKKREATEALSDELPISDKSPGPAQQAGRHELEVAVTHALEALPTDYRMVITLRDIQGLSAEETSRTLKLSIPAVKSRLHRARVFLREKLGESFLLPEHPTSGGNE